MAKRFDRLGWAMAQEHTTPTQRFVLLILADMSNEQGECWPKHATIAARTGYGVSTVRKALDELEHDLDLIGKSMRTDHGGRQTSNLYRLRVPGDSTLEADEGASSEQGEVPGASTSTRTNQKQPPNRKNNSLTTSKSRSSRRASARRRDDDGWADPSRAMFDKPEEPEEDVSHRGGPDSAWGLNKYYRDSVQVAGNGFLGNTNDEVLRGFFARAKREGVTSATLRTMVDLFVTDVRLFDKATEARWKVFIANAESLRQRACVVDAKSFEDVAEFGGSIPQHILDEILAEVG